MLVQISCQCSENSLFSLIYHKVNTSAAKKDNKAYKVRARKKSVSCYCNPEQLDSGRFDDLVLHQKCWVCICFENVYCKTVFSVF